MATSKEGTGAAGVAVDAHGGPAVDPTENVKALSEAANKRQDDLRLATDEVFDAKLAGVIALMNARLDAQNMYTEQDRRHLSESAKGEARRIDEQAQLRAFYSERLEMAEAKRIDAIRAVDVNAVAVASQRAADQAAVLAQQVTSSAEQLRSQVAQSAEALRSLVATTANTVATSQQQLATSLSERLTKLEQAQYEGKGRALYTDPQTAELLQKVNLLSELSKSSAGAASGAAGSWATTVSVIGMLSAFAAMGITLFVAFGRSPSTTSPQVIYAPAPAVATPSPTSAR